MNLAITGDMCRSWEGGLSIESSGLSNVRAKAARACLGSAVNRGHVRLSIEGGASAVNRGHVWGRADHRWQREYSKWTIEGQITHVRILRVCDKQHQKQVPDKRPTPLEAMNLE